MILAVVLPVLVHSVEAVMCLAGIKNRVAHSIADISWTFASVDVLLLSAFTIQVRCLSFPSSLSSRQTDRTSGSLRWKRRKRVF